MDNSFLERANESVSEGLEEHIRVLRELSDQSGTVVSIADMMIQALRSGRKVLAFGNGGSAADAQHLVGELMGRLYYDRVPLPAIALSTNTSSLTAIANDYDYADVFVRQLEALGQPGDVAVGISTSGRSENVLKALHLAKAKGLTTIALTGQAGISMQENVDVCLAVPSTDTPRIQEGHIAAIHLICQLVEREWHEE